MEKTIKTTEVDGHKLQNELIEMIIGPSNPHESDEKSIASELLRDIIGPADHKKLALHMFSISTVYVARNAKLNKLQLGVLSNILSRLQRDWVQEGDKPSESNTRPSTASQYYDAKTDYTPQTSSGFRDATPDDKDTEPDAIDEVCEGLKSVVIERSPTPKGWVRETEKRGAGSCEPAAAPQQKVSGKLAFKYPTGYRIMRKWGWDGESGLGPNGNGITTRVRAGPVIVCSYRGPQRAAPGLGYKVPTCRVNTYAARKYKRRIDQERK